MVFWGVIYLIAFAYDISHMRWSIMQFFVISLVFFFFLVLIYIVIRILYCLPGFSLVEQVKMVNLT